MLGTNSSTSANIMSITGGQLNVNGAGAEDWLAELSSQQDRERVIELLLSQERVIALLYEKTFAMTSADPGNYNDSVQHPGAATGEYRNQQREMEEEEQYNEEEDYGEEMGDAGGEEEQVEEI